MTPTQESSDDIAVIVRDALHQIRTRSLRDAPVYLSHVNSAELDLKRAIEQLLVEARIDELKKIPVDVHKVHGSHTNYCMRIGYRNGRIRILKQQAQLKDTNHTEEKKV